MIDDVGSGLPSDGETAAVLDDIRLAEEQIARGEGMGHDVAEQMILASLHESARKPDER